METTTTPITRALIQRYADEIARQFHPQQVMLFGSFARGTSTPDSDVDLLVLMETSQSNVAQAVEIRQRVDFPFPVDLLVRTPHQLAERIKIGDVFFAEVIAKGIVLYEANYSGVDR